MNEFEIYCNYGVLGAQKWNTYTYFSEHAHAMYSDKIKVALPENPWFRLFENSYGMLCVDTSWGWWYEINEILQGDKKPCFYALDPDMKGHRVYLEVIEDE